MCLPPIFAANSIDCFIAKCVSGPHVFLRFRLCMARVRGIDGSRVAPLSSTVICIESITSLYWGGSPRLPFPMYVWLLCRAVTDLTKQDFLGDAGLESCLIALP